MVFRAVLFAVCTLTFVVASLNAQAPFGQNFPAPGSMGGQMGGHGNLAPSWGNLSSINGSVRSADGRTISNARVELRSATTGTVVSSAYTGDGGLFEFRELPRGAYEVTATFGTQQANQRVDASTMVTTVDLRLPTASQADDGMGRTTVSVSQYRVPESARNELRKGQEAASRGKHDEAQEHVAKALERYPNFADALTLRAILKLDAHDMAGAIEDLNSAIHIDANCAAAYMVLGSAFNVQSKFDDAIRTLEHVASLAPNAWQLYFELGRAHAGKHDFEAALHDLDRAATLAPAGFPFIRLVRAHVLLNLKKFGDAATDLEAYLAKNPNDETASQAKQMLEQARAGMATAQR